MNKNFWIFIGLIVLAPLPFGMVFELTQAFFACAILSLVLAYCALLLKEKNPPAVSVKSIWPETWDFSWCLDGVSCSWLILPLKACIIPCEPKLGGF